MKILFITLSFVISLFSFNYISANNQDLYKKLDVFGDVFDIIKSNYVEDIDDEKVIEYAINASIIGSIFKLYGFRNLYWYARRN